MKARNLKVIYTVKRKIIIPILLFCVGLLYFTIYYFVYYFGNFNFNYVGLKLVFFPCLYISISYFVVLLISLKTNITYSVSNSFVRISKLVVSLLITIYYSMLGLAFILKNEPMLIITRYNWMFYLFGLIYGLNSTTVIKKEKVK